MIKIALLDDHAILRDGIKHLLNSEADLHVCAECERPSQLEPLLEMHRPDLLIIDLNMPEGGGFPLLQRIQPGYPELLVIVLSMHENPGFVSKALSYGVNAYITKTRAADELVLAIRTVVNGNRYLSSDVARGMQRPEVRLSPRERDVLRRGDVLIAKKQHAVVEERLADGGEGLIGQRMGDIDPMHEGAEC